MPYKNCIIMKSSRKSKISGIPVNVDPLVDPRSHRTVFKYVYNQGCLRDKIYFQNIL